jgi:predicted RNA methylase
MGQFARQNLRLKHSDRRFMFANLEISSPAKRRHRSGKPLDNKFHHCKHATS